MSALSKRAADRVAGACPDSAESRSEFESARVRSELARLRPEVARAVARRCRDSHEVDDVVQESLLRALRYASALRSGAPLRPWLVQIARNVLVDRARIDAGRRSLFAIEDVGGELGAEPFGRECEPPDILEPGEDFWLEDGQPLSFATACRLLARARSRLVPFDRQLLFEHYELCWPCRESAERHGVAQQTLKVRLFRARARLRTLFEREVALHAGRQREAVA
ncbi:RNA polymerase sigma factor [Engelhardtia mirabilis]|uniref:RNA polymerase sigma factor n=1 Tax=Engelhardtia mirabilis TaxID=2528011 RepID=A0A518BRW9_9BACT|nr:RNA polymerase sigma factor SigM [Planctomycetes bacterium Pla133]QDV04048.1 RNA polymerase sigma factor SigM [Planctomycetes bacterium Pla86]